MKIDDGRCYGRLLSGVVLAARHSLAMEPWKGVWEGRMRGMCGRAASAIVLIVHVIAGNKYGEKSQDCWRESASVGEMSSGHEAGGLITRSHSPATRAHQENGEREVGDGRDAAGFKERVMREVTGSGRKNPSPGSEAT